MDKDIISILIVDDEKYEGILMEKGVDWEKEGFRITAVVQSAEEALKVMEEELPDIVYTDINMPIMDGLELSRRIRKEYPAVHIVIVTGFREFEYAREAIHIGVEDFLLKPIQADEMLATAVKVREQILKLREEKTKQVESFPVLCQELVRRIVTGYIDVNDAIGKLIAYNMPLLYQSRMRGFLLETKLGSNNLMLSVLEAMNQAVGERNYWYTFLEKNKVFFVIGERENTAAQIGQVFEELSAVSQEETLVVSVSNPCESIEDCPKLLSECEEASVNTMKDKGKTLIFYQEYVGCMEEISRSYPVNFDAYRLAVKSGDQEAAIAFIDRYLERYIFDGPLLIPQLRNLGILILHNTLSIMKEYNKYFNDAEQMKLLETISHMNTLQEFCRTSYSLIEKVIGAVAENSTGNNMVRKAQEYIENNLDREGLSLNMIASELFVNASYLSRIFKQTAGESITKYIMRKRIEKSMDLFDQTDLKVYEVAAAVGMPDAHYFGTCFKRYTGKTVNEYKSKNRNLLGK
ncbi:response regulator [Ruminococcus sp. 5_1_39BFAA]|uniref:response regulator transcription factor n=1 Tax=Ruminococcus sp. 5_1_39BFAA TaxID=457412 RepID=UPI00356B2BFC